MDYPLRITDSALNDLDAIVGEMLRREPKASAAEWLNGLSRAVASLGKDAGESAPEGAELGSFPRQILYRTHRILFDIGEGGIDVLRIYPGAGQNLTLNLLKPFGLVG